ncbi:MAG: type II secretion system protein [Patescibacteria group bacterium]
MKGFTLIELIIVMGMLVIVATLSVPFFQSFQVSSDLYTHANTITKTLQRAQQQAITGQNNDAWGVYFDIAAKKIILFKGNNYASRQTDFDEIISYPQTFSVTTDFGNEIYFSLYSGQTAKTGTVNITSQNNQTRTIKIESNGLIQLNG